MLQSMGTQLGNWTTTAKQRGISLVLEPLPKEGMGCEGQKSKCHCCQTPAHSGLSSGGFCRLASPGHSAHNPGLLSSTSCSPRSLQPWAGSLVCAIQTEITYYVPDTFQTLNLGKHGWVRSKSSSFGFPWWLIGKESACGAEDARSTPGSEDPLEQDIVTHSSVVAWRIPTDREVWRAAVHGAAKSRTWLKWLSNSLR